ncbi:MAG: hypothetical protein EOO75_07530, partial [Myxococcales bacterium]
MSLADHGGTATVEGATRGASVGEALRALVPPDDAPEAAYLPAFRRLAGLLLGQATLHVAGRPQRLTEIEFYVDGAGHRDPFTHGDPLQQESGRWYFHR